MQWEDRSDQLQAIYVFLPWYIYISGFELSEALLIATFEFSQMKDMQKVIKHAHEMQ